MAPAFWMLCRCNACSRFSRVTAQGERVFGREWNKNSITYKEHLKPREKLPNPSYTAPRPLTRSSTIIEQSTHPPPPEPSKSPSPSGTPAPEIALWKGKVIDCVLLAACQYLFLNLSGQAADRTLACLKGLVSDLPVCPERLYTPTDIRTLLDDLHLTPDIKRTVCCPRCFYLYPVKSPPHKCTARETRRSRKCLEPLLKASMKSRAARRYFSTQSLTEWLARFLARPGIEDLLEESVSTAPKPSCLSDIWDSTMWETLETSDGQKFTSSLGNLVFSLNVDWFNPSGNKTAGKHISLGTVALICLNLPPHLRASHDNIFLAGLIPGPSEPSVTQINHVLKPVVEELQELWTGVKLNSTANHPNGRIIRVMLGPIVCDLPAILLYELPYFDPLSHAIVEPMHNIFLGLLSHHGKDLFGLKITEKKKTNQTNKRRFQSKRNLRNECESEAGDSNVSDTEIEGSVDELLGPLQDLGVTFTAGPSSPSNCRPDSPSDSESSSLIASDQNPTEASSDQDSTSAVDDDIPTNLNPLGARFFGKAKNLEILREVNKEFQLPSWIGRVPSTVGSAGGGKLKADEWVILFEIIMIPTLIRILFEQNDSNVGFETGILENLLHLSSITNIVRSLEVGKDDIKALRFHLKAYRQGLLDIFPSFSTKPNHHLALHLPDCLTQFGPAPQWTAWSFERLNGSLASIPTNNHIDKRDVTLMRRWTTAQNLRNLLPWDQELSLASPTGAIRATL
ncbi:hypothetical protein PSTT_10100 [Puccinia striiformis]|uniref:Uncharacterized protein n=1 Tax=Puccinia striiformis TaxID=27350 RepID=A0A2S4V5T0_9BASI|nr:hypothetical protein PSTT_10100 [Puccinia striiformis]